MKTKRFITLALALSIAALMAAPAMAAAPDDELQPAAAVMIDGGMLYDTSVGQHYIHGTVFGSYELKTVSVLLYRESGTDWVFVDSCSDSGTEAEISTGKHVSLSKGYYRVDVKGISQTHSGTIPYYYTVE